MATSTSAKVSVGSNVVLLGLLAAAWLGWPEAAPWPYAAHKFLHLLGIVTFLGNLIAGPLWLWFAAYQDGGRHLRFAVRTLDAADVWLTTPGVQLTAWNGLALAAALGGAQRAPWLVEALAWLVLTSLFSLVLLIPLQSAVVRAAEGDDAAATRRALIRWSVAGMIVMLPLTAVAWLMVAKVPLILR
jgi:uncharacterized membrane protein